MSAPRKARIVAQRYLTASDGIASAELVFWLAMLIPVLFNVVDLGMYVSQRMQVHNAAQMGAQAAWAAWPNCSPPASGCATLTSAVGNAIKSTSLSTGVTKVAMTEGYRCRDVDTLTLGTSFSSPPSCSSGGSPGYYLKLDVKYTYTPAISGVSLASLLAGDINESAWTRLK